jgi:hypothetical protein
MFFKHDMGQTGYDGASPQNPFGDLSELWARTSDFQRHTLRVNGIYELPWGLFVSGILRYGSGNYTSIVGGNPLGAAGVNRVRPDLTIIPRNTFKLDPVHAFDARISKTIRLGGNLRLEGIAEMFNLFNAASYGYNTIEGSATYGQRESASRPRAGQVAVKLTF